VRRWYRWYRWYRLYRLYRWYRWYHSKTEPKEDPLMRSNSHWSCWSWPPRLRLPQTGVRLLAIVATLGALALAVGACSLTAGSTSGSGGFTSNTGSVTTGKGQTTPVKILRGGGGTAMVLVPVTIDDQGPYDFALDTGAGITLIDTQLANELKLPVAGESAQVAGVGGTQDITPVHVDTWSAGKIALPTANIGKTGLASFKQDSGVRGLLGSDILSSFGKITINYDTGELSAWDVVGSQTDGASISALRIAAATEARRPRAA
jgi:Aspartyl protease